MKLMNLSDLYYCFDRKKMKLINYYDTAGRLNVDGEMMLEIQDLKDKLSPTEIFYIAEVWLGKMLFRQ